MKGTVLSVNDILPAGWRDVFKPTGRIGIGTDLGTTTKAKSNPTGVAVIQEDGRDLVARLVVRFKTADERVLPALLRQLCQLPHGLRVRKVCADATNERFFVARIKRELAGLVVVEPVVASDGVEYGGEKMNMKTFLGALLVNTIEDGRLLLPRAEWLRDDIRSVKRDRGSFSADVDADGNHADCFDGLKLALFALRGLAAGPAVAAAAAVGTFGATPAGRSGVRGLVGRLIGHFTRRMT